MIGFYPDIHTLSASKHYLICQSMTVLGKCLQEEFFKEEEYNAYCQAVEQHLDPVPPPANIYEQHLDPVPPPANIFDSDTSMDESYNAYMAELTGDPGRSIDPQDTPTASSPPSAGQPAVQPLSTATSLPPGLLAQYTAAAAATVSRQSLLKPRPTPILSWQCQQKP